jgi:hypothetical protein
MKALKIAPLPLPVTSNRPRKAFQADIDLALWRACEIEIKKRGLTQVQVCEWALKCFLLEANPNVASQLGISEEE